MTVLGVDVSRWNSTPSLSGLSFLFARATYNTFVDPRYVTHTTAARAAGLIVGAYHFGVNGPVAAQVSAFLSVAAKAQLLVLDLEKDGDNPRMTDDQARQFIAGVHARGRKIGLYHSRSGFPDLGQDYNWVAQWSATPPTGVSWSFWQYSGVGLDRDQYSGSWLQLRAMAGLTVPTAIRYRVTISGYTPLYVIPNGARVGAVRSASYICTRSKVGGLWWYRIVSKVDGSPTLNGGRYFKPNRFTASRYA